MEKLSPSPCSNMLYRADPGSPVSRRLQYLHIPNHTTRPPPPLPPLTLLPPPPPPPCPCSPHHPSLSPPPEAVVSTHKLSHVQQTLPCSQGQRRRQRPGQAESSPVVCRIRAKVGSLLYSLHVAQQQHRAANPACTINCLHDCLDPGPACLANPIHTTRANRQHGRRRVMIGTACRTTYTNNTPLRLPMCLPLLPSYAPSPLQRRTTHHHRLQPTLEPG